MNNTLYHSLNEVSNQLQNIYRSLVSFNGERPYRCKKNIHLYKEWYNNLSEEEKEAELALIQKGYYSYERTNNMFDCKDKTGQQIHIDDIVEFENLETTERLEGVVMMIYSEDKVQVNPIKDGLPLLLPPDGLSVVSSFVEKVKGLRSDEELLAILRGNEELFAAMQKSTESMKKAKKPAVIIEEFDM